MLPKTSTFNDVAENLSKSVKIAPGGSGKIRIFDITPSGRAQREYTSSEMIGNLQDPAELWAEEIPLEEINAPENSKVVNMFHYARDISRPHGVPCRFVLVEVSETLPRLPLSPPLLALPDTCHTVKRPSLALDSV